MKNEVLQELVTTTSCNEADIDASERFESRYKTCACDRDNETFYHSIDDSLDHHFTLLFHHTYAIKIVTVLNVHHGDSMLNIPERISRMNGALVQVRTNKTDDDIETWHLCGTINVTDPARTVEAQTYVIDCNETRGDAVRLLLKTNETQNDTSTELAAALELSEIWVSGYRRAGKYSYSSSSL